MGGQEGGGKRAEREGRRGDAGARGSRQGLELRRDGELTRALWWGRGGGSGGEVGMRALLSSDLQAGRGVAEEEQRIRRRRACIVGLGSDGRECTFGCRH